MIKSHTFFGLVFFALWMPALCLAQELESIESIGLRFSSDFNHFRKAEKFPLVDHWFSTGVFGVFWRSYRPHSGVEAGLSIVYKGGGSNSFNLPLVMKDFVKPSENIVGLTAVELDMRVGPRFEALHPKIGYILGYQLSQEGFFEPGHSDKKTQSHISAIAL